VDGISLGGDFETEAVGGGDPRKSNGFEARDGRSCFAGVVVVQSSRSVNPEVVDDVVLVSIRIILCDRG
jgi:hypothetical protein